MAHPHLVGPVVAGALLALVAVRLRREIRGVLVVVRRVVVVRRHLVVRRALVVRPGVAVQVVVTAADATGTGVGVIVGSPVEFGANQGAQTVQFDPNSLGSSVVTVCRRLASPRRATIGSSPSR